MVHDPGQSVLVGHRSATRKKLLIFGPALISRQNSETHNETAESYLF
jgi:hypothetical protein